MTRHPDIHTISDPAFPGFRIGWTRPLDPEVCDQILSNIVKGKPSDKGGETTDRQVLGGRSSVKIFQIPGNERMVVKPFLRGGMFRFFVRNRYFRFSGGSRAYLEFSMLNQARDFGINTPVPLGFFEQGRFWYRCWLVTKLVPQAETLAAVSLRDEKRSKEMMPRVMEQIELLVRHGLVHADLHPGNVLISRDETNDQDSRVWIIDFDKAGLKAIAPDALFRQYQKRWNRAVSKHGLPSLLSGLFSRPES